MEPATQVAFGPEGPEVVRAVLGAVQHDPRNVRVHLSLLIEEDRMGPRPKRVAVQSVARAGIAWTQDDVIALVNEAYSLDYVYGGRVLGGVATIVAETDDADLMDAPMRRVGTRTCLAVSDSAEWETSRGTCVFDFIESRYKGARAARRAELVETFARVCADPLSRGVTTAAVAAFARRANVRMIAAGPDGVVFHRERGTDKRPCLAYAVANGHMFPVLDPAEVAYMTRFGLLRHRSSERGASTHRARVPIVDEASACDLVAVAHAPRIVVTTADLTGVWTRAMLVARRTFPAATTHGTFRVVRFRANGVVVYANEEYPELRLLARRIGTRCAPGDGIGSLSRRFFDTRVPSLARLGLAGVPPRLRVGQSPRAALLGRGGEYTANARCFDVRGCYASALRENGGLEWAVPGPFDELEPYDAAPLGPGRYLVVEPLGPASPLVVGDGWYYERYARWRVSRGATVVMQQRARRTLPSDTFAGAVDECRALIGQESKRVINAFIGTTFPRARERGRCVATTELAEARAMADAVREQDGTALAFRSLPPARQRDLGFLYEQIVEGGWVSVDELRESLASVGGSFVAVKTDAVVVDFSPSLGALGPLDPLGPLGIGPLDKWREEPVGARVAVRLPLPARGGSRVPDREWADVAEERASDGETSVLVVGAAGTGKSVLARRIASDHEARGARVARVAPTNKAAAHIGGITVHALFGLTNPEAFCDPPDIRSILRVRRAYDYVLVDEVFMCAGWMFGAMALLRALGVSFVLSGDPHQLPPVGEEIDPLVVRDSSCVHDLCGGRRVTLTEPRRSVADTGCLFAACAELIASPPSRESNAAFVARFARHEPTTTTRAVSFLNATAARFNREQAVRPRRGGRWLVYAAEGESGDGVVLVTQWTLRRVGPSARVYPLRAPLIAGSSLFVPRGTLATLRSIDERFVTVEAAGTGVRVPRAEFSAAFDLAYCVTIHRSQCETIAEPYAVLDSRKIVALSPAYARALLYVAASRATHAHFVRFG